MRRLLTHTAVVIAVGSLVAGCGPSSHLIKPDKVGDKTWVLTSVDGSSPVDSTRVTMEFKPVTPEQGRISGLGPCNRYFGGYKVEGKKNLSFTPMGSTMMACPTDMMQEEKDYLANFEKVNQMSLNKNMLVLKDSNGQVSMTYSLETGHVRGRVESTSGGFPAESQVVVRLQDVSLMDDSRSAIIGLETIKLRDAVLGSVPFDVAYAPKLVQPGRTYAVYVQVMNKGKVIYTSTAKHKVKLTPPQVKKSAKG